MNDWLQVNASESARLATDGIYGPNTRDATVAFQQDAGITVDGTVGRETRGAMVDALSG